MRSDNWFNKHAPPQQKFFFKKMSCLKCGHTPKENEIHIFRGGEYHRWLTRLQTGRFVSTCKFLVPDDEMDQTVFDDEKQEWVESRSAPSNAELEKTAKKIYENIGAEGWVPLASSTEIEEEEINEVVGQFQ